MYAYPRHVLVLRRLIWQWYNICTIVYGFTIIATKLAILFLYKRVFVTRVFVTRRWSFLDITIIVLGASIIVFYFTTTFIKIFLCSPRAKILDPTIPGNCFSVPALLISSGVFNVISDFMLLIVPAFTLRGVRLSTKKRILIFIGFTVGIWYDAFFIL